MASNEVSILISIREAGQAVLGRVGQGMKDLNLTSKAYHSTLQGLNGYVNEFNRNLQGLIGIIGGFRVAKGFIDTAAAFEKNRMMLEGLSGSAKQAEQDFEWIKNFQAPFSMESLSNAFIKLRVSGIEPTDGSLRILTDAVAAFGGGSQELDRVVVAISQMAGKGVISMEELRQQLGEQLPTAMKLMAQEMGLSMSQLVARISSGSLDAKTGLEALFRGLEKEYKGAGERMMSGWNGLMINIGRSWKTLEDTLMKAGVFDALKNVLSGLQDALKSAEFTSAAKEIGKAITEVITDLKDLGKGAYDVIKGMGPLLDLFVKALPYIIEWALAWGALRIALGALIGLPLSIFREFSALNKAISVLSATKTAEWVKGLLSTLSTGLGTLTAFQTAVLALGSAIVVAFAYKNVSEFITVFREYLGVQKEIDKVAKKYAEEADKFKDYQNVKVRSLNELKLMEEEQLGAEYNYLQNSLKYWKNYIESLEQKISSMDSGIFSNVQFGEIADTGTPEIDEYKQKLSEAKQALAGVMEAMGKLGQAARANNVNLEEMGDKAKKAGEQSKAGMDKAKVSADNLKDKIAELGKEYEKMSKELGHAYDFAAQKAEALAADERSGKNAALEIYRQKTVTIIGEAQKIYDRQKLLFDQIPKDDQKRADIQKSIEENLRNAKIKAVEDWRSKLESSLIQAINDEKKYAAEVEQLQNHLRDIQVSGQDRIRELTRRTMTDEQAYLDKRKQAYETLSAAQSAMYRSETPDGLKAAEALAKKAEDQFASLAGEVKNGEQVIKTEAQTVADATKGINEALAVQERSAQKQIEMTQQLQQQRQKDIAGYQKELGDVKTTLEAIAAMQVNPKMTVQVDTAAADAAIERLKQPTSSVHTIHVQTVQANRLGGMIRQFAEGGWNRLSGQLPGWGGGDRVRALLEDGEFVIRKEAVRKYGAAIFNMLNSMTVDLPKLFALSLPAMPDIPKTAFATGGTVSAVSDYGTLRLQAGGVELPVTVHGSGGRQMVKDFERELSKLKLTRGR